MNSVLSQKLIALKRVIDSEIELNAPDMNVPSFERLEFEAMVRLALSKADSPRAIVGSSLGGLVVLELVRRGVRAPLVLIAPAVGIGEVDKASEAWGVKVLRYEIKNITPPQDVLAAMEKQMRAEREKRALILQSEGQRDAAINSAEGEKQQTIKKSEAKKQQAINEAEGQAAAILSVAQATAEGIKKVADALKTPGGGEAMQLRIAEQYITQFGNIAKSGNTMIVPANLADVATMLAMATGGLKVAGGPEAKLSARSAVVSS